MGFVGKRAGLARDVSPSSRSRFEGVFVAAEDLARDSPARSWVSPSSGPCTR